MEDGTCLGIDAGLAGSRMKYKLEMMAMQPLFTDMRLSWSKSQHSRHRPTPFLDQSPNLKRQFCTRRLTRNGLIFHSEPLSRWACSWNIWRPWNLNCQWFDFPRAWRAWCWTEVQRQRLSTLVHRFYPQPTKVLLCFILIIALIVLSETPLNVSVSIACSDIAASRVLRSFSIAATQNCRWSLARSLARYLYTGLLFNHIRYQDTISTPITLLLLT